MDWYDDGRSIGGLIWIGIAIVIIGLVLTGGDCCKATIPVGVIVLLGAKYARQISSH